MTSLVHAPFKASCSRSGARKHCHQRGEASLVMYPEGVYPARLLRMPTGRPAGTQCRACAVAARGLRPESRLSRRVDHVTGRSARVVVASGRLGFSSPVACLQDTHGPECETYGCEARTRKGARGAPEEQGSAPAE